MKTLVVGVDGTGQSLAALRWAVEEARLRGATVRAVHAWMLPPVSTMHEALRALRVEERPMHEEARELLDSAVRVAVPEPGVEIEQIVGEGPPAAVLLENASDAELIVIGGHRHDGLRDLVLGSVRREVEQHAPCPVVVVCAPVTDEQPHATPADVSS